MICFNLRNRNQCNLLFLIPKIFSLTFFLAMGHIPPLVLSPIEIKLILDYLDNYLLIYYSPIFIRSFGNFISLQQNLNLSIQKIK